MSKPFTRGGDRGPKLPALRARSGAAPAAQPPRSGLPEDHLAWFVLDAVEQLDLGDFYAAYRADGWGRAAFEPRMMLALLLYAYAVGERSSRAIERRCAEDVAFRVIAANQIPDHAADRPLLLAPAFFARRETD